MNSLRYYITLQYGVLQAKVEIDECLAILIRAMELSKNTIYYQDIYTDYIEHLNKTILALYWEEFGVLWNGKYEAHVDDNNFILITAS